MANIVISGDTSGSVTLSAPAVSGTTTLTLPTTSGTVLTTAGGSTVPFALGSAAAPSITFTGDTNTGMFSPGADTIAFSEGGVESMRIDASGNLGLGVTPSAWSTKALQVNGASLFGYTNINTSLGANFYFDGTNNRYISNGAASLFQLEIGGAKWFTAGSGTAGGTITFTQSLTLNNSGALALQGASTSATGVGITFPATQSASSDANTLDDYEEGTWTPTVTSAGGGSGTTSYATGTYVKIGSLIQYNLFVKITALSGTSGALRIGSFPFAVAARPNFVDYPLAPQVVAASTIYVGNLIEGSTVYDTGINVSTIVTNNEVRITGTYQSI